jgi:hypothetical protein
MRLRLLLLWGSLVASACGRSFSEDLVKTTTGGATGALGTGTTAASGTTGSGTSGNGTTGSSTAGTTGITTMGIGSTSAATTSSTGVGTTSSSSSSGTTTSGSTTGGNCGVGQCVLADGSCGWDSVGSGPCGLTGVTGNLDCCPGLVCTSNNFCVQANGGAVCNANSQCESGICGISGTGHCCNSSCSTNGICGATDCDTSGACAYPGSTTPCLAGSCSGNTQISGSFCDGMGGCPSQSTTDCTPYVCAGTQCLTSCTDTTSCTSAHFCDPVGQLCCPNLAAGGTLYVDSVQGSEGVCCGGAQTPCTTLNEAMAIIDADSLGGTTIVTTVDGGGGDWNPAAESYPVHLGWGVELSAPGVYFLDPLGNARAAIFDIDNYSTSDTFGYASMVGTAVDPIGVGMNAANTVQTDDTSAIRVAAGNTLYIANANVNGSADNPHQIQCIRLVAGATLWPGADQSGAVTGTVTIGNTLGNESTDGYQGIVCDTDGVSRGCTIQDAPLVGQSALIIQGQEYIDIQAEDFSSITLTSNPVIGVPPSDAGFNTCPSKRDAKLVNGSAAIQLNGAATLTFKNGTVQCIASPAFQLVSPGTNGPPKAIIDNTIIRNTDLAIYATAGGIASVTNSTLQYNFVGVQQDTDGVADGTVDLGDGGNTVICSSNVESSTLNMYPGIDVFNTSAATLQASNVAWDTASPDFFTCDTNTPPTCSCALAACSTDAGSNDMDAVSTTDAGIDTTGNTQSPHGCN